MVAHDFSNGKSTDLNTGAQAVEIRFGHIDRAKKQGQVNYVRDVLNVLFGTACNLKWNDGENVKDVGGEVTQKEVDAAKELKEKVRKGMCTDKACAKVLFDCWKQSPDLNHNVILEVVEKTFVQGK